VAPTEAGDKLIATVAPAFNSIDAQLASLGELRERPSGSIRITATEHAATTVLWPVLRRLLPDYPEINVELSIDSSLTDIVSGRFDAGVRLGEAVAKDMVAIRIGPDLRMAVVGSPAYFANHPAPQIPQDLADHRCINLRLPTAGGFYAWELEKGGRSVRVRVEGQLAFNNVPMIVRAAEDGLGLGFIMEDQVADRLADRRLVCTLEDWCPPFTGYHLYYPSRRQPPAAFALVVDALRFRNAHPAADRSLERDRLRLTSRKA
jgi:DNA-binding transcriptional LysR family regulator